jgi:hypothetical protein
MIYKLRSAAIWIAIAVLAGFVQQAVAQTTTTGEIVGTVKDTSGAVVPNATVTLKSADTGDTRTATSDASGVYRFSFLKPGPYQVSAASAGLSGSAVRTNATLGQSVVADLLLKPQTASTVVEVTESAAIVNTDTAASNTTYGTAQVQNLPTPGGDITAVAFTAPGVVVSTGAGYGAFSSHGLPATSNLFTMNGNDNMDPYLNLNNTGASNLTLGQNEVAEAAIVQNPYAVQYGRNAGTQVNYVTKSGANRVHGDLLWKYNGDALNANDFFNNSSGTARPHAVSNQWGADIGGPIIKNKLFFYADAEGIRYVLPTQSTVAAPSSQLQSYILGNVSGSTKDYYQKMFNYYNTAPGFASARPVTNGGGQLQDSLGTLGCGQNASEFVGTSAPSGGQFGVNVPCAVAWNSNVNSENDEWLATTRIDYNLNDRHRMFFRYKTDQGIQPTYTDPINPIFNAVSKQPSYEGQFKLNSVLSSNVVNDFTFAAISYSALFSPSNITATQAAFPEAIQIVDGGANGAGQFTAVGLGTGYPQGRENGQYQIIDDFAVIRGSHSMKFGVNYRHNNVTDYYPSADTYVGQYYIFDLGEFASGAFNNNDYGSYFQKTYTNLPPVNIQLYSAGFYAQDEWAVRPNLKLTFGLRMDTNSNPTCDQNCYARFYTQFDQTQKGASIPYNQTIRTGLNNLYPNVSWFVPQPRFGVVYSPGDHKTVFRGGIGLFSDLAPATVAINVFRNSPNVFSPAVLAGDILASGSNSGPALGQQSFNALQTGFNSGYTLAQLQDATGGTFSRPPFYSVPNTLLNAKYLEYSFEIERQFGSRNAITISYFGNHGFDEFVRNLQANAYASPTGSKAGFAGLPSAAPDPRFSTVTQLQQNGYSNYNGLTVQYRRGLGYGLQGQINYTWGHALDVVSNNGLEFFNASSLSPAQIDPRGLSLNYSNADYDARHTVSGDMLWEVPFRFSNRLVKQALGGWSIGSRLTYHTGFPFSVYNSQLRGRISPNVGSSPLAVLTNPTVSRSCTDVNVTCFTTADFETIATQTTFGNLPRNSFYGPNYFDMDIRVSKMFQISESLKLGIGAEAFNALNHPNFDLPSGNVALPGLGGISSTVSGPSSAYGSFQGSAVSGRVLVLNAKIVF